MKNVSKAQKNDDFPVVSAVQHGTLPRFLVCFSWGSCQQPDMDSHN